MQNILYAFAVLGGMGLVFGVLLGIASKAFYVKKDERVEKIVECLPGANCGGCGCAGCSDLAAKIVSGEAGVSACSVNSSENIAKIAEIMGVEASDALAKRAHVKCRGAIGVAEERYVYDGIDDCVVANRLGGGPKMCAFACLGLGSCVKVCKFDAIEIKNGVAVVNDEKCTGCGMCADICPKGVIEIIPKGKPTIVNCNSKEKGVSVTKACRAGCIGCGLCVKACEKGAVKIENNLAVVDYSICDGCGECEKKCPKGCIGLPIHEDI